MTSFLGKRAAAWVLNSKDEVIDQPQSTLRCVQRPYEMSRPWKGTAMSRIVERPEEPVNLEDTYQMKALKMDIQDDRQRTIAIFIAQSLGRD